MIFQKSENEISVNFGGLQNVDQSIGDLQRIRKRTKIDIGNNANLICENNDRLSYYVFSDKQLLVD